MIYSACLRRHHVTKQQQKLFDNENNKQRFLALQYNAFEQQNIITIAISKASQYNYVIILRKNVNLLVYTFYWLGYKCKPCYFIQA